MISNQFSFSRLLMLLLWSLWIPSIRAQNQAGLLDSLNKRIPIEKLYLQLDRDLYFSGQEVWFKGYFMSGFLPSASNSTLFVELLNNQSTLILRKVLPVFGAVSYGDFKLPDTLSTGSYQLRAYSPLMLNYDKQFLFSRRIEVFGKEKASNTENKISTAVQIRFFPEGGNLIAGLSNNIAFKVTDSNGLPVDVRGSIKNQRGETVTPFSSFHDGMGVFALTPVSGDSYYAVVEPSTTNLKSNLPQAVQEGITLAIKNVVGEKEFSMVQKGSNPAFKPAYLIGQMQHQVVFKHALSGAGSPIHGIIPTSGLPSGILQITVFNAAGMPLAERLTFIDNKEYRLPFTMRLDTLQTAARKLNHFSLRLQDSVTGNFSVSVTDADFDLTGKRQANIWSEFLLTSDLPGYVYRPAWYFSGNDSTVRAMDMLMMTNGWRRFKWTDLAAGKMPSLQYKDEAYISLSGQVKLRGSKKSFAGRDLMVWVTTPDSARTMQLVKTDASGKFRMDSMVFFDKAKILFSDVMGDKSRFITVRLNRDSLYHAYDLPLLQIPNAGMSSSSSGPLNNMSLAHRDYVRGEGLMLDNVTVHGIKNSTSQLEAKYMSPLFAGGINAKTFDLTREFIPQVNLFEYLMGRVAGLTIVRDRSGFDNYSLYYRQAGLSRPMQLYLDEMPADASMISSIPVSDIALVKLYPTFIGAPGGGANGVLAVYTKRGNELNDYYDQKGEIVDYDGYSIIKEFYQPDYSRPVENRFADYRLTLDWNPEIYVNGLNPVIPVRFYNNDRTKKFRVVAEGITSDGKLLMYESVIEPGKR
jgi:hypothetical protein